MIDSKQRYRRWTQAGFFALFVLAPVFDMFRFDLNQGHFYLFGQAWTLGLEPLQQGQISATEAAFNILYRGFLPLALVVTVFIYTAWRWGRLYCGWLCPHYSVVETINRLMVRAIGKPSLWENRPLPQIQADGRCLIPAGNWFFLSVVGSHITHLLTAAG